MIELINLPSEAPYKKLEALYYQALKQSERH